jgi:Phosphotransferase enzyme family
MPTDKKLLKATRKTLGLNGPSRIRSRKRIELGTFPKELVTLELQDQSRPALLYKYSHPAPKSHFAGHSRFGLEYESRVHRKILSGLPITSPRLCGRYVDKKGGTTWLLLEYIPKSMRVHEASDPKAMERAADWLGAFHALGAQELRRRRLPWLKAHPDKRYLAWCSAVIDRLRLLGLPSSEVEWISDALGQSLCDLAMMEDVVVHGEYFPKNILCSRGRIYPTDWESAFRGQGEIDLATLAFGWDANTIQACKKSYCQARWSDSPPRPFEPALRGARVLARLRWTSPSELRSESDAVSFLAQLKVEAEGKL